MIARNATLSIYGLYLYDSTLFDNLVIPKNAQNQDAFNKNDFVDNLVVELTELELLYPNFEFMKNIIGLWSKKELPTWQKLYNTTVLEYNPIWNKDGEITESRSVTGSNTKTYNLSIDDQESGTNTSSGTGSNENKVSAYNETGYHNREKSDATNSASVVFGHKNEQDQTGTVGDTNTVSETISRTETGNIGITTTQQMIREEREVSTFNIQNYIIQEFKRRFCVLVY